jgi:hypothetical protein
MRPPGAAAQRTALVRRGKRVNAAGCAHQQLVGLGLARAVVNKHDANAVATCGSSSLRALGPRCGSAAVAAPRLQLARCASSRAASRVRAWKAL